MALKDAVFSQTDPDTLFICGRLGVWRSPDRGRTFSPMKTGYPSSAFDRETNSLLLVNSGEKRHLFAGNRAGLFSWDFEDEIWTKIFPQGSGRVEVRDILSAAGEVLVFTEEGCIRLEDAGQSYAAVPMPLKFKTRSLERMSMIKFMLRIHDGSIFGIPGKLFVDVMGGILIFSALSAVGLWYIPKRRKKGVKRRHDIRIYRFLNRYHLKWGIYSLIFILVITLTGMIIRRPFRGIIAGQTVPAAWTKAEGDGGQTPVIRQAVFLANENALLLATRSGFFKGPLDFSNPFVEAPMAVPVSGMGTSVLEVLSGNRLLVGSFAGLYFVDTARGMVTHTVHFPGTMKSRAVGAIVNNGTLRFWVDYHRGIAAVGHWDPLFRMPEQLEKSSGMSLWQFMRALHTGNLFRTWFGPFTWLIVPAGGLLLVVSLLTGGYDWLHRKGLNRF